MNVMKVQPDGEILGYKGKLNNISHISKDKQNLNLRLFWVETNLATGFVAQQYSICVVQKQW